MDLATEILIGRAITTFVTCGSVIDMSARISGHLGRLVAEDYVKLKRCLRKLDLRAKMDCIKSVIHQCKKQGYYDRPIEDEIEGATKSPDKDLTVSLINDYLPETTDESTPISEGTGEGTAEGEPNMRILNPIELHIYYLYDTMKDISRELEVINRKVLEHKQLYVSNYRSLCVDTCLANLESLDTILKQRYDRLINLLTIPFMHTAHSDHIPLATDLGSDNLLTD